MKFISNLIGARRRVVNKNDVPHSLTLYVIFSILVVLIYTVVELIVSTISGISHDTLTTCVYGFFAGEVVVCGLIKIFKLKNKEDMNNGLEE